MSELSNKLIRMCIPEKNTDPVFRGCGKNKCSLSAMSAATKRQEALTQLEKRLAKNPVKNKQELALVREALS